MVPVHMRTGTPQFLNTLVVDNTTIKPGEDVFYFSLDKAPSNKKIDVNTMSLSTFLSAPVYMKSALVNGGSSFGLEYLNMPIDSMKYLTISFNPNREQPFTFVTTNNISGNTNSTNNASTTITGPIDVIINLFNQAKDYLILNPLIGIIALLLVGYLLMYNKSQPNVPQMPMNYLPQYMPYNGYNRYGYM